MYKYRDKKGSCTRFSSSCRESSCFCRPPATNLESRERFLERSSCSWMVGQQLVEVAKQFAPLLQADFLNKKSSFKDL